jgi:hypothetical protein
MPIWSMLVRCDAGHPEKLEQKIGPSKPAEVWSPALSSRHAYDQLLKLTLPETPSAV